MMSRIITIDLKCFSTEKNLKISSSKKKLKSNYGLIKRDLK